MDWTKLTPVVEHSDGLCLKRDDLFAPWGAGGPNGGKLRQCFALISNAIQKERPAGVVTGCSIHSPQCAIVPAVCREFNLSCTVYLGGTTKERLRELPMVRLAVKYGARIALCGTGRHSGLYHRIRCAAKEERLFVVEYGMNLHNDPAAIIESVASQVENLPEELDRLILTCGSGITATGVLLGLQLHRKRVGRVVLVGNGPNRRQFIRENLGVLSERLRIPALKEARFDLLDMYNEPGFDYARRLEGVRLRGARLHPNYEGKAWAHVCKRDPVRAGEKAVFWIVGAEPNGA